MKHIEKQHPNAFTYNIEQMKSNSTNEHTGPSAERDVDEKMRMKKKFRPALVVFLQLSQLPLSLQC